MAQRGRRVSARWWPATGGAARFELGRPSPRARLLELVVVIVLLAALIHAGIDRLEEIQSQARSAALAGVRASFHTAVQLVHLKWHASGLVGPGLVKVGEDRRVWVNAAGWPTIDPRHTEQDSAPELYALLVSGGLAPSWLSSERPAREGGQAIFALHGRGGGAIAYDAKRGSVSLVGR